MKHKVFILLVLSGAALAGIVPVRTDRIVRDSTAPHRSPYVNVMDMNFIGDVNIVGVLQTEDFLITSLTADRLVATDVNKYFESSDLINWLSTNDANYVILTDDGSGGAIIDVNGTYIISLIDFNDANSVYLLLDGSNANTTINIQGEILENVSRLAVGTTHSAAGGEIILYVREVPIQTTGNWWGQYIYAEKTEGATNYADNQTIMGFEYYLDQYDGEVGNIYGLDYDLWIVDGNVGDSSNAREVVALEQTCTVGSPGGEVIVWGDLFGWNSEMQVTSNGTVTDDFFGIYNEVTTAGDGNVAGDMYGIYSWLDNDGTVGGTSYNVYLKDSTDIDYCIYQDGTAPSRLASLIFPDSDTSPDVVGELLYDNTVAELENGALAWYDGESVRYIVDLNIPPTSSEDDYVVAYDADVNEFYLMSGGGADAFTVKVDAAATADYIGAANSDGVLRAGTSLSYTDGGNYVTLDAIQDIRTASTTFTITTPFTITPASSISDIRTNNANALMRFLASRSSASSDSFRWCLNDTTELMALQHGGRLDVLDDIYAGDDIGGDRLIISGTDLPIATFTNTNTSGSGQGAGMMGYSDDGAALASGDRLGYFGFGGSVNATHTLYNGAAMTAFTTEAWSAGNCGTKITFETTADGAGARTEQMTIGQDGGIHMPNMKSGINQGAAGAAAGELWYDTDDDNTVKMGV